jgi:hypothetical protein
MALLAMQSCVRNDLEDCPPSVRYAISFEFLLHTVLDENENPVERFAEDVDKLNIYVFDRNSNVCIYADTTLTGPFGKNDIFNLPLEGGNYDIIVWGWGRNTGDPNLNRSTGVIPAIRPGVTTIEQARFILNEKSNGNDNIYGKIEKTFYGEIIGKYIPPNISQIDTVYLKNISKMIRIIIPDIEDDPINIPDWKNNVKITVEGDNGAYLFRNNSGTVGFDVTPRIDPNLVAGHVINNPFQKFTEKRSIDSLLQKGPVFTRGLERDLDILVVDISTLRLVEGDTNMKVVITWNSGIKEEQIEIPLLQVITRNPEYAWAANIQRDLDRQEKWEIIFRITDTYVSVATNVMQWDIVKQDVGIGGIMQ